MVCLRLFWSESSSRRRNDGCVTSIATRVRFGNENTDSGNVVRFGQAIMLSMVNDLRLPMESGKLVNVLSRAVLSAVNRDRLPMSTGRQVIIVQLMMCNVSKFVMLQMKCGTRVRLGNVSMTSACKCTSCAIDAGNSVRFGHLLRVRRVIFGYSEPKFSGRLVRSGDY